MSFDFRNIRTFNGSQDNGFEELVCQLAHLEKIDKQKTFIRKEGAGGDAGIECYWKLNNDEEIGWQAKFFLNGMDSSKWGQIDKSFETALDKHPKLKKFIVCLPLDRTDSRKVGKGGKTVVSLQDEWNERVNKWTLISQKKGRSVEFDFWGKHEMVYRLTIEEPAYAGRALYWFDDPIINTQIFKNIANKARESLGDRYTPEFHIELPISKSCDGLCLNPVWWNLLSDMLLDLNKHCESFFNSFFNSEDKVLNNKDVTELNNYSSSILNALAKCITHKDHISINDELTKTIPRILEYEDELYSNNAETFNEKVKQREIFNNFFDEYGKLYRFIKSPSFRASKVTSALIYGDPGIGKSHMLCDLSLNRIEEDLPTIFLLGTHYTGGNPINLIKEALDLSSYNNNQVLGALDAAGEAKRARTLIVIDAINEGVYRDEWRDHIRAFLTELARFDNLCVLFSCRDTYLNYLLPDSIDETNLVKIHHSGFQGYEHRAAEKYLSQQGISKPSAPILAPEFTNPLFLKTCCHAIKVSGATSFPRGLQGITNLFNFYLQSIEKTISRRKMYSPSEEIIKSCLILIAAKLFPDDINGIPITEARQIINELDPNPNRGQSLFNELLHEGVISEDISYMKNEKGKPVIRFTYERFSDHYIALQVIEKYTQSNIEHIFKSDQPLGKIISNRGYYVYEGVFEALAILLAEKYGIEMVDLFRKETEFDNTFLENIFSRNVIWRSSGSFTAYSGSKRTPIPFQSGQ